MKKVAVFENEFSNLKSSFDAVNLLYYENELVFEIFKTSQDFGDLNRLQEYDYIIVDIDLTPKSQMDGYQILSYLKNGLKPAAKIVVLTGHIDIEGQLEKLGLRNIPIIAKPVTHKEIRNALQA